MSLREQMLKAGLVSQNQAKKAETEARQKSHKLKKDKTAAAAEAARKAAEAQQRKAAAERQRARDRQLNQERENQKKRHEAAARIRQLMASHRANDAKAEILYNFLVTEKTIDYVRVTPQQQRLLALGRIAVARNPDNPFDFPLLPRDTAAKIAESNKELILLLHPETDHLEPDRVETQGN
jgi:uncharacterized protein YaiL (DUF2058 family)